ncbi:hypothetical protein ACQ4N7_01170 [Nodosilinea sp. AN01ver1]|uniref:hypothetical protein n=1 Tax=Nodosilinea sp. AN01ver1 TaxID=3423362 RepID=UPI003D315F85
MAYSEADQAFYVGRPEPEPPTTFLPVNSDQSAAIDALAADIASLDSSQTIQDIAIAAIEADESAQNTAIAALSAASSGHTDAIATLQTRPTAFTYDQQAEPSSPAAGATWRERSAGGLIVETWQWDGTYWEKPATEFVTLFNWATQISATTGTYGNPMGFAYKLLGHRLNCALASAPQSGNDYWEFFGLNGGLIFDSRNLAGLTTTAVNTYVSMLETPSIHAAGDLPGSAMRALRQGSAGVIRRGGLIALYRRIRA